MKFSLRANGIHGIWTPHWYIQPVNTVNSYGSWRYSTVYLCHKQLVFPGLYAAAHKRDVEWIIIKGVSEYAGDSTSDKTAWREFASLMAASLTAHILSDAAVFQDWPHYKSASECFLT